MTDRQTLHALIDQIPEEGLKDARRLLKEYLDSREDYEDEERTPEEIAGMAEAEADIQAGRVKSWEQVKAERGL